MRFVIIFLGFSCHQLFLVLNILLFIVFERFISNFIVTAIFIGHHVKRDLILGCMIY